MYEYTHANDKINNSIVYQKKIVWFISQITLMIMQKDTIEL